MPAFLVAGAGIAGLTAAVALGRCGFPVQVAERRVELDAAGAGLQLSPNATRVARELGFLAALEKVALEPNRLEIRRGTDGAHIASVPLGAAARARFGAPTLVLHRADLQRVLAEAVASLPSVALALQTEVLDDDPQQGSATLSGPDGTTSARFDGIIRADGVHATMAGRSRPVRSGKTAWRALIPARDLAPELTLPQTNLWLGTRAHIVHYPLSGGSMVNLVFVVDDGPADERDGGDFWAVVGDPAELETRLRGWHALPQQLVRRAPAWRKWPLLVRPTAAWTAGRRTLAGDAAHPMLPFLAQGASQAFEDAPALAQAVLDHRDDIPTAFQAYERRRTSRARQVQQASERQGRIYHMSGPAALARDLTMRLLGPERLLAGMDWLYAGDGRRGG